MTHGWAALVVASLLLQLAPGPGTLFVISRGATGGTRAGVLAALGVSAAVAAWAVAAACGMATVFDKAPLLFDALRIAGAGYLFWLAGHHFRDALQHRGTAVATMRARVPPAQGAFTQGMINTAANPQALLFFVAFLPQVFPSGSRTQLLAGGIVFMLIGLPIVLCLAAFSGWIHNRVLDRARARRTLDALAGSSLAILGSFTLRDITLP